MVKKIRKTLGLVVAMLMLAYLSFMLFLWTGWFLDDSIVFKLSNFDWAKIAAGRLMIALIISSLFGILEYFFLRICFGWKEKGVMPFWFTIASLLVPTSISIYQAVWFFISKPYM